jgi:hypothetical protein
MLCSHWADFSSSCEKDSSLFSSSGDSFSKLLSVLLFEKSFGSSGEAFDGAR